MRIPLWSCLLVLVACSSVDGGRSERGNASISGKIAYPSEVTPPMRICAVRSNARPICRDSAAGSTHYRFRQLPAGDYQIVAKLSEGDMRVGGHMQQVQCIRAPCPAQLQTISLAAGADVTGIDLNEFYPAREDFPPIP
jgi:hypothetical protein